MDLLFQWLIAHRQNRLEWLPLWGASWVDPMSALRQSRLRTLTTMAHEWGLLVAPDAAIAERQQHGWYMTNATGTLASQTASIAYHLDWFMAAGFDYLSTGTRHTCMSSAWLSRPIVCVLFPREWL